MSITTVKPWPKMTGRDEFRFLADLVLKRSSADQTVVNLHDQHSGTTRFASSRIIQNVDTRRGTLTVTVAFDGHRGSASTTDFSTGSVQDALARAERIARVSRGSGISAAPGSANLSDAPNEPAGDGRGGSAATFGICERSHRTVPY